MRARGWHWRAYAAEAAGTALLVFCGLSAVIVDFAPGSPVPARLPGAFALRLVTGLLFGGSGALVALSPLGRISGAHLDPVLSFAFWATGSLGLQDALMYSGAQFAGAVAGAAPLAPLFGRAGAAVHLGATLPVAGIWRALLGEAGATAVLVGSILWFVGHPRLRRFTPALLPPLVAVLVAVEAPWSGTSMNPARSFGPALFAHTLGSFWIYAAGPACGAALGAVASVRPGRVHVAKIAHHAHDPAGRFHGSAAGSPAARLRPGAGAQRPGG